MKVVFPSGVRACVCVCVCVCGVFRFHAVMICPCIVSIFLVLYRMTYSLGGDVVPSHPPILLHQ